MMIEFVFYFSAAAVLPFWFAMIVFPTSKVTERMVRSPWIGVASPVACYLLLVLSNTDKLVLTSSPEAITDFLSQPWAATLFWAYAGAFDLFVGRWIYWDARERGISPWWVSPALFVAIILGPVGFAMYGTVVAVHTLTSSDDDNIARPKGKLG